MSRRTREAVRVGHRATLLGYSSSGKAIEVSIQLREGSTKRATMWWPISQIDDDSEIYGRDVDGRLQAKGADGVLIVSRWISEQVDKRADIRRLGIPLHVYACTDE